MLHIWMDVHFQTEGRFTRINRILQIIYHLCGIRQHRSHPATNYILFLLKSHSLQNKMVFTDKDGMASALCIVHFNFLLCYTKDTYQ